MDAAATRSPLAQQHVQVFRQKDQMERVRRRLLESEAQVERLRPLVLRVGDQAPNAGVLGDGGEAEHRFLEEGPTQSSALVSTIDAEPSEDHDRYGTIRGLTL